MGILNNTDFLNISLKKKTDFFPSFLPKEILNRNFELFIRYEYVVRMFENVYK